MASNNKSITLVYEEPNENSRKFYRMILSDNRLIKHWGRIPGDVATPAEGEDIEDFVARMREYAGGEIKEQNGEIDELADEYDRTLSKKVGKGYHVVADGAITKEDMRTMMVAQL